MMNLKVIGCLLAACTMCGRDLKTSYKFDFGGKPAQGYTEVLDTATFTRETGYGFEAEPALHSVNSQARNALHDGFVTGAKPFFFSAALPEGNTK